MENQTNCNFQFIVNFKLNLFLFKFEKIAEKFPHSSLQTSLGELSSDTLFKMSANSQSILNEIIGPIHFFILNIMEWNLFYKVASEAEQ